MSGLTQPSILRWKEWIPLVTQQLRLRSLIRVTAYNIQVDGDKLKIKKKKKRSYYFTLHLTAMSSPFYTSEQLESENPKWAELDIKNDEYGSANGVVVRLWVHSPDEQEEDRVITVWGIYFSGLAYIGSQLGSTDASSFCPNSIVLHMHGGYFTAHHCFINPHPVTPRTLSIQLTALQVKPSYTVKLLLKLQSLKQGIKKESEATSALREQITEVMFTYPAGNDRSSRGSMTLRKLLKQARPRADPRQVLAVKRQIEMAKFRVRLLGEQRDLVQVAVQKKLTEKNNILEKNQDRESILMENFCLLRRDSDKKRDLKLELNECKNQLIQTAALLEMRRRELISQLSYIYPIAELPDGRFTIRDVHLPNSEDFEGRDELMVSVALGFVAHLVQMISYFLDVPTRYPVCHFGSRSKIIDHITESIPDKEREFPLYSRGKERHAFNYGVYLLNKNIAQLRWYCGLSTSDLRHTLPNLQALLCLNRKDEMKRCIEIRRNQKRSALSFSLDQGLNNVASKEVTSDPQHYTTTVERRRAQTDRGPAPRAHDLASLMLLDIPNQSNLTMKDRFSDQEGTQAPPSSDLAAFRNEGITDSSLPTFTLDGAETEVKEETFNVFPPALSSLNESKSSETPVLGEGSPQSLNDTSVINNSQNDSSKSDPFQNFNESTSNGNTSICDSIISINIESSENSSAENSHDSKEVEDNT